MKPTAILSAILALVVPVPAFADGFAWSAHVNYITFNSNGSVDVTLVDTPNFTGCLLGTSVTMDPSFISESRIAEMKSIFLAAQLSNKKVEVSSVGCFGNQGKVSYVRIFTY